MTLLKTKSYPELVVALATLEDPSLAAGERRRLRSALREDVLRRDLVTHLRTTLMGAGKRDRLPEVLDRLDQVLLDIDLEPVDSFESGFLGNLAHVAPRTFWSKHPDLRRAFRAFDYFTTTRFLSRESNYTRLLAELQADPGIRLSPVLAAHAAFRSGRLARTQQLKLLRLLLSTLDDTDGTDSAREVISSRLSHITAEPPAARLATPRAALLIAGPLEDPHAAALWRRYFDLQNLDVFAAVDCPPPVPAPVQESLADWVRHEDLTAVKKAFSESDLARIARYASTRDSRPYGESARMLQNALHDAANRWIHIADPDTSRHEDQLISHLNSHWPQALGHQFFIDRYDILIKFDPRLRLQDHYRIGPDTLEYPGRDIVCSSPDWLFEYWGFGMGDRLFYGRPEEVLPLLDLTSQARISSRFLHDCCGLETTYRQHISTGIEHWLRGGTIRPMRLATSSPRPLKLSLIELQQLAPMAGVGSPTVSSGSLRSTEHARVR